MKKCIIYLTIPALLFFMQACNTNAASNASTNDTIPNDTSYNDGSATERPAKQKGKKENANQSDNTNNGSDKKSNAVRISESELPNAVSSAFNNKYPGITSAKWVKVDKRGRNLYKARWQANGKKTNAIFSEDGNFVKEKQPK